jgi:hypothetical protein
MATGGFSGSDAALSLEQLKSYVASGQLRFIVAGGRGIGDGSSNVSSWVTSACTAVTVDGTPTSVYDCSGAVTGG